MAGGAAGAAAAPALPDGYVGGAGDDVEASVGIQATVSGSSQSGLCCAETGRETITPSEAVIAPRITVILSAWTNVLREYRDIAYLRSSDRLDPPSNGGLMPVLDSEDGNPNRFLHTVACMHVCPVFAL